ncbi:hypothetical protein GQ600_10079 [Phytophthora cactorum]|nr:hypothetical protein GQ600_10079 [Phytophthora cactorum]
METSIGSSVRVFDGTTDFRVWRARVENELMRYHLLGYVMVRGSQSFTYNGEEVPPRTPVIHVDEEQQQSMIKEEISCGRNSTAMQRGRLSRWDVLGESAEAKGILQRYLHPDVESAILNKNIYDSWKMLCALYDNRSNPGAHDVSTDVQTSHLAEKSTDKPAAVKPVAQPISKPPEKQWITQLANSGEATPKPVSKPAEKQVEKPVEQRAAEATTANPNKQSHRLLM